MHFSTASVFFFILCVFVCLQASLNKLMETLDQSEPYFVKCIRSNAEKVSSAFTLFFSLFFCPFTAPTLCLPLVSPPASTAFQRQPGAQTAEVHGHAGNRPHQTIRIQHQIHLPGNAASSLLALTDTHPAAPCENRGPCNTSSFAGICASLSRPAASRHQPDQVGHQGLLQTDPPPACRLSSGPHHGAASRLLAFFFFFPFGVRSQAAIQFFLLFFLFF